MSGTSQYFEPEPATPSQPRLIELVLPDGRFDLEADRGVFSAGAVDAGTKLLLLESRASMNAPAGDLLDLGCGYGPIAVVLAHRFPGATIWAVDVNRRALELCTRNAARHGLSNIRAVEPDAVPGDVRFAGIWSNPPIRIGKPALHALLSEWLDRLDPAGRAWLVVQKHLGSDSLARWLVENGWPTERIAARSGYRLLEVSPR